jgi:hypothetical protein
MASEAITWRRRAFIAELEVPYPCARLEGEVWIFFDEWSFAGDARPQMGNRLTIRGENWRVTVAGAGALRATLDNRS